MAYIHMVDVTSSSITVCLEGTDGDYPNDSRWLYWYITESPDEPDVWDSIFSENLAPTDTCSQDQTFDGLYPETTYYIHCLVEWGGGTLESGQGQWFEPLEVTTLYDYTPEIKINLFSVEDNGDLSATCTWIVSDYIDTYNWYINGATESSSFSGTESSSTYSETIWFDGPGEYDITFIVRDIYTGYTDYITENVFIADPDTTPEIAINLFSVEDNGDLSATCTWIVSDYIDTYSWMIQGAKETYVCNEEYYVSSTQIIEFNEAGEYTIIFVVIDNVSKKTFSIRETVIISEPEQEPEQEWNLYDCGLYVLTGNQYVEIDLKEYSTYMFELRSPASRILGRFYTIGDIETRFYASASSSFDKNTGKPTTPMSITNQFVLPNGSDAYSLSLYSHMPRYLFVRSNDGASIGTITLCMFDGSLWNLGDTHGHIEISKNEYIHIETEHNTFYRFSISFTNSGEVKFYIKGEEYCGNDKLNMYLSTVDTYDSETGIADNDIINANGSAVDGVSMSYNVQSGQTYYLWVRSVSQFYRGFIDLYINTSGQGESVQAWSWEIGTGSDKDIAYRAINKQSGYSVQDFKYSVWNDLVNRVYETAIFSAGHDSASISGWLTEDDEGNTYLDYSDTLMDGSTEIGRTLTADRFNALKYNIGARESTGIPNQVPGNEVKGSYFITLTECLNAWIERLNG